MFNKLTPIKKKEKGVAGMNVYLALISMVFLIGIILMVFQIAGSQLQESVRSTTNDTAAIKAINDTQSSLENATDFFPIFIVLGALVVLVLLVVIIINSIRASGLTGEGA